VNTEIFVLKNAFEVNRLMSHLKPNWRKASTSNKPLVVTVMDKPEDRSKAQNRLYWKWVAQFANHFGNDKDEVHHMWKKQFLVRIYVRESKNPDSKFDKQYAKTWEAIKAVKMAECEQWEAISEGVIHATSTTDADVTMFTEYLDEIYNFSRSQGLWLSCPDDLRFVREMSEK